MIFAAGLATRLGDLSRNTPKALIDVGGTTMLERTIRCLVDAGADRIVINVHHHANRIGVFVEKLEVPAALLLSHEPGAPLETGGGLLHARRLFRGDAPFFLHNVDIITGADLPAAYAAHQQSEALVTLLVNERDTARRLLFDAEGLLGRIDARAGTRTEVRRSHGDVHAIAFAGIHVASPALLERISERGVFSITDVYLRLAGEGARILPFRIDPARWHEIGTPERLAAAREALA
jgi:NDP-sugar pyrophosphorylase family protein